MDFAKAWESRVEEVADSGSEKQNTQAVIMFGEDTASMGMPYYFCDTDDAGKTLHKAWETFCRDDVDLLNSIKCIIIEEKREIVASVRTRPVRMSA